MDIKLIQIIRKKFGLSISECIYVLNKNNLNIEKTIHYISNNNIFKDKIISKEKNDIKKKSIVMSFSNKEKKFGFIIKISSNTDFTLMNEKLISIYKDIKETVLTNKIKNIFDLKKEFNNKLIFLSNIFKENINIEDFYTLCGNYIFNYNHMNKYAVIISSNDIIENNNKINILKNISMQIISNDINYIKNEDITDDYIINNFININNNYDESIIKNKIKDFRDNKILLNQLYMFDETKNISDILEYNNIKIYNFKLLKK